MDKRNRATGWKYAKLSGHENEVNVKHLLETSEELKKYFKSKTKNDEKTILSISVGGLREPNVPSILSNSTKSKTDMKVSFVDGTSTNVSIKKETGGQVYLVNVSNFITAFEKQFCKIIPNNVKRAMNLFWANADDAVPIITQYSDKTKTKNYNLQIRHRSLNADTLYRYDPKLYSALIQWFIDNIQDVAIMAFSRGATKNYSDWAEYIWYINTLKENNLNDIFLINDICLKCIKHAKNDIFFGSRYGGTTIQLPFGFVQWHQKSMQFHHSIDKIHHLLHDNLTEI